MKGAISAHSGSVRSLAYLSPTRACWRRVSSVQAIVISVQLCNRTEAQPAELTQLVSNWALRQKRQNLVSSELLAKNNRARPGCAMRMKNILCQIKADDGRVCHLSLLSVTFR